MAIIKHMVFVVHYVSAEVQVPYKNPSRVKKKLIYYKCTIIVKKNTEIATAEYARRFYRQ